MSTKSQYRGMKVRMFIVSPQHDVKLCCLAPICSFKIGTRYTIFSHKLTSKAGNVLCLYLSSHKFTDTGK